jgi:hypothetical protein
MMLSQDLVPPGARMTVWVVYDHPKDFPDNYVARPQFIMSDDSIVPCQMAFISDDLEKIRGALERTGLYCVTRMPGDDPKIVETWL